MYQNMKSIFKNNLGQQILKNFRVSSAIEFNNYRKQTDRQTDKQTDRRTDRQTDIARHIDRQTNRLESE